MLLKAVIDFNRSPVTVFVTHFGLTREESENASKTVVKSVSAADTPIILMGDFNVTPENPIHNPIRDILTDTAAAFEKPLLSFPSTYR